MTMHDFPDPEVVLPHRVSYGETDAMGVLYYAEYLHLFERARSAYIRQFGVSYAQIEQKGLYLPVREAQCRYRASARYDDLVLVRAAVSEWGRASLRVVYEMWNEDKTSLLAQGMTQHAIVNGQGRPVGMPPWFRELFRKPQGSPGQPGEAAS
jgi:acyl-CoA thioester hydrolase